jgi:hypothetical protein
LFSTSIRSKSIWLKFSCQGWIMYSIQSKKKRYCWSTIAFVIGSSNTHILKCESQKIEDNDSCLLGLQIDENLGWKVHIKKVEKKFQKVIIYYGGIQIKLQLVLKNNLWELCKMSYTLLSTCLGRSKDLQFETLDKIVIQNMVKNWQKTFPHS